MRDDFSLFEEALALFDRERLVAPVRLVGFGVSGLTDGGGQQELDLFGAGRGEVELERRGRLSDAVDALRRKLGKNAVTHLR